MKLFFKWAIACPLVIIFIDRLEVVDRFNPNQISTFRVKFETKIFGGKKKKKKKKRNKMERNVLTNGGNKPTAFTSLWDSEASTSVKSVRYDLTPKQMQNY